MSSTKSKAIAIHVALLVALALCGRGVNAQSNPLHAPPNGPPNLEAGWHALTGGTVHLDPKTVFENATLVIRDGRIAALNPKGAVPPGARVWDCEGLHLYAGLIDPYVDVDTPLPDAELAGTHWNSQVTPERSVLDGAGLSEKDKGALRKLGFAVAALSPKGGLLRGRAAVVSLATEESDRSRPRAPIHRRDAYQAVGLLRSRGRGGYPGSLMGRIALVRQSLHDARWTHRNPGKAGVSALSSLQLEGGRFLLEGNDELDLFRLSAIAKEFDLDDVIYLGSGLEFRRLDPLVATIGKHPLIVPLNFPEAPSVSTLAEAEGVDLRTLMSWEQAPTNPRRLLAAGVDLALTSSKTRKRSDFHASLRRAIEHGLDREDALALLTTRPARLLGIADRCGTLKTGSVANVLVCDGELFEAKTKIRDLWIDGRRHEITPAPQRKIEGRWIAKLSLGEGESLTLEIDAKNAITVNAGKKKVKARGVKLQGERIAFTFDRKELGEKGVLTLAGLIDVDHETDGVRGLSGAGLDPEGRSFEWSAVRAPKTPKAEKPEDSDPKEEAAPKKDALAKGEKDGAGAAKKRLAKDDEDTSKKKAEDEAASVPEDLGGFPFGPYAVKTRPESECVHFKNATLWTASKQGIIEGGSLLIADGKILFVGKDEDCADFLSRARFAQKIRVIDLEGAHITPGLIDCHSHTGISGGVNEGGQAVTSEVRIGDVTNPDSISWYRQLAGGVTCVNNLHGSANPIGGQNQVNKIRWGVRTPDALHFEGATTGIKFALGENVKRSNSSRSPTRYPSTRMGVEALIRERFIAAGEYAERRAANPEGERRDLELEALAEILAGERLIHCHSYRQDEILMLCRVAQDFGFKIGTFQHVLEGYKVAHAIRETALGASAFSDWWAYKIEVQDAIPFAGAIMHEQGVVVSFNSDSDELARRMNQEAAKAVKYGGLDEHEALKFVTLNPARQLRIDGRVGSLEVGKDADLALWSGHPLSSFTRCVSTWVDGRNEWNLEKDRQHRERIRTQRRRLLQKLLRKGASGKRGGSGRGRPGPRHDDHDHDGDTDAIREHYLHLLRMGIDPEAARCGQCGRKDHR